MCRSNEIVYVIECCYCAIKRTCAFWERSCVVLVKVYLDLVDSFGVYPVPQDDIVNPC